MLIIGLEKCQATNADIEVLTVFLVAISLNIFGLMELLDTHLTRE